MRPDPDDATPVFLAAVLCVMLALIASLASHTRAITAVPTSFDVDGTAWAADQIHAPMPWNGDLAVLFER